MSLSIVLAFGAMFGWGVGDFLIQRTVKKIGEIGTLVWITFFSSFILLPIAFHDILLLNSKQIVLLLILGVADFASGFVHLKALSIGKLSVVEIILSIELPLTILLGIIFFAEKLTLTQTILIIFLFIGIILISVDFKKINKKDFLEKGSLLALLSAVLIAIVNFFSAAQAREISPIMALWLPWMFCGLISISCIKIKDFQIFLGASKKNWRLILAMVIVDTFAWVAYMFAVAKEELSITIAITESFVVVAMMLGIVFNQEKINRIQYLGAALAISCSIIIAFI